MYGIDRWQLSKFNADRHQMNFSLIIVFSPAEDSNATASTDSTAPIAHWSITAPSRRVTTMDHVPGTLGDYESNQI